MYMELADMEERGGVLAYVNRKIGQPLIEN